jgi:hypothetical protein
MASQENRPNKKSQDNKHGEGDTSRTSSQGRKESSGGGKAKKGAAEADKNLKARKI